MLAMVLIKQCTYSIDAINSHRKIRLYFKGTILYTVRLTHACNFKAGLDSVVILETYPSVLHNLYNKLRCKMSYQDLCNFVMSQQLSAIS